LRTPNRSITVTVEPGLAVASVFPAKSVYVVVAKKVEWLAMVSVSSSPRKR
jgi:hypothetical protein